MMRWLWIVLKWFTVIAIPAIAAFLIFAPAIFEKRANAVSGYDPIPISDQAQYLHDGLMIGDWHADSLLWKRNLLERGTRGQVDIPRLMEGRVAVQVFTAVTKSPAGQNYEENSGQAFDNITLLAIGQLWPVKTWGSLFERADYMAAKLHDMADASDGTVKIIRTLSDLEWVLGTQFGPKRVLGAILGLEGAHPLEGDIRNLEQLDRAGYRLVGLQHFFDNELGGSLHGTADNGLTEFGRQVVAEVEKRGMVLDVAHSSQQVVRDVLAITDMPIVLSHTGIHSHCETTRNIPDELMKEIAATGGVIGIGYWADVTCDDSPAGVAKTIAAAVNLVGEDHVSLGSDYDGTVTTTFDTSDLIVLTQALLNEGLNDAQITKIMGENMFRVLRERLKN